MDPLKVTLENGKTLECKPGTIVGSLCPAPRADSGLDYIAALVNNDTASLSYPLTTNCSVRFLTMADPNGWRIYRRSLCFLLAKTVKELYPDSEFSVDHSFGLGLYCSLREPGKDGCSHETVEAIENRMMELTQKNITIERHKIAFTEAIEEFRRSGQLDKINLLKYRNPPRVVLHWCDGFSDLSHGPLVQKTGMLRFFKLIHYKPGFVLHLPDRKHAGKIPPFEDQPHLFNIFQEHKKWGRILGVDTVGKLNEITATGGIEHFILTAEALHEKKLSGIADQITESKARVILIAGPSCAGKTTFSKRLATHLMVNGLKPVTIEMDDYFVGPESNPLDENGNPDFEHIEAVDLELFNRNMLDLLDGKEVDLPNFNFSKKSREYLGRKLKINPDQPVIIEGIHGLNPRLTEKIPQKTKFKIYISALTQLSVDSHNRISTTDNRLMRRIVRDHNFRAYHAIETMRQWPSVRRGEKKWIFPFQKEADATFNSALDYELAVLKPIVEPLLMQIKPNNPEYAEARRLTEFLLNFLGTPDNPVPRTSILREYIGGSCFDY